MKLSSHNARMDASGLHNDRNFDLTLAPHILMDRLEDNKYFSYNGDLSVPFIESEEEYYREHFSPYLDNRKKRSEEARQYARIKSISDYHTDKATRPEDKIIQIGDKDDHISGDHLWEICLEYQKKFDKLYGNASFRQLPGSFTAGQSGSDYGCLHALLLLRAVFLTAVFLVVFLAAAEEERLTIRSPSRLSI